MPTASIEIKKRFGIYYTPQTVAKFLLRHSLQHRISTIVQMAYKAARRKDPLHFRLAVRRLSEIKVLDPACGDGVFLIEALDMIEDGYSILRSTCRKNSIRFQDLEGGAHNNVTHITGLQIALTNLFGVDIDAKAINTTIERLSRHLERKDRNQDSESFQIPLKQLNYALTLNFKAANALKILPVDWNSKSEKFKMWIKELAVQRAQICDNLFLQASEEQNHPYDPPLKQEIEDISSDIFKKTKLLSEQLENRSTRSVSLAPNDLFVWELNFPEVFVRENPGFDVVCGNPPYINLEAIKNSKMSHFLRTSNRWRNLYRGKGDIQYHFLLLAIQLLREKGHLAMVTSRYWPENKNADALRRRFMEDTKLLMLMDLDEFVLFDAAVHNLLLILEKSKTRSKYSFKFQRIDNPTLPILELLEKEQDIDWLQLGSQEVFRNVDGPWQLLSSDKAEIIAKIESILEGPGQCGFRLDEVTHIGEGIKTGNDAVFASFEHIGKDCYRNRFDKCQNQYQFEGGLIRPVITSSNEILHFCLKPEKTFILCTHKIGEEIHHYPVAESYLNRFIENLDTLSSVTKNPKPLGQRYAVVVEKKTPYDVVRYNEEIFGPWNEHKERFDFPKKGVIFGRYRNREACFGFSERDICCLTNTVAISSKKIFGCSMRYLLALLNSAVVDFYVRFGKRKKKGRVQEYRRSTLQDIPIRVLNVQDPDEKRVHDSIVAKTKELEHLQKAMLPESSICKHLQEQYSRTKKELDSIIFQLYSLADVAEEISNYLERAV
ncbi:MAG: Eco57I restriction-modification methylase domain-containing protein [Candidatus Hodarchaeales archaeon]|jgi:hypothetical protein